MGVASFPSTLCSTFRMRAPTNPSVMGSAPKRQACLTDLVLDNEAVNRC